MSNQGANSNYWGALREGVSSLVEGLRLSFRHLKDARNHRPPIGVEDGEYFAYDKGIVTLQYPKEEIPVPDNGRYKLHNEIDDCIVCDKCAKVCPVDCIDIEPVRSAEEIGKTSDGTSRRIYAAKFDIDMAKCCFCGLCTTVCPTECLTMTSEYDFSVFNIQEHNFAFSQMTQEEIATKQSEWDKHQAEKQAAKATKPASAVKPTAKPIAKPSPNTEAQALAKSLMDKKKAEKHATEEKLSTAKPKPAYRPKVPVKKAKPADGEAIQEAKEDTPKPAKPKPVYRPKVPVKKAKSSEEDTSPETTEEKPQAANPKPVYRPKVPVKKAKPAEDIGHDDAKSENPPAAKPKPIYRPKVPVKKPKPPEEGGDA